MQKKAQFWYADFLIAILILVAVSFLFIKNITDLNSKQDKLQSITNDAIAISSFLMSEGYCPTNDCLNDWGDPFNKDGRIGFVKEGRIIKDNLEEITAETFVTITRFVYFDADGDNKGEIIKLIIVVW